MTNWILIKDNKVVNTIVADESFIELIKDDYDDIVNHDEHPQNVSPESKARKKEDGSWVFNELDTEYYLKFVAPLVETPIMVDSVRIEPDQPLSIDAPTEGESI